MPTPMTAYVQDCRAAAKALRRLPAEVKREVKAQVRTEVADPFARKVAAAAPDARISAATKVSVDTVPRIKIGAARRVYSGGASTRDVVFGREFGGGDSYNTVTRRTKSGTVKYRRRTTRQFTKSPFVFPTARREMPTLLEGFGRIVDDVLDKAWRRG